MRAFSYVVLGCFLGMAPFSAQAARPRTCVEQANDHGDFSIFQAQRLCAGAQTTAPADCGNLATRYFLTEQAVYLCTYAQSVTPVQCALAAERSGLTTHQIMYACSQAQNTAPADCVIAAKRMGAFFTGDQMAQLCFQAVDLTPVFCAQTELLRTHSTYTAVATCRAFQPVTPPGNPFDPNPLPFPGPGGGGGPGMFTSCTLTTAASSYTGIGFTEGQATAAARDQCLQVESVLKCDAGHATCR
jgi:hypothetical protein